MKRNRYFDDRKDGDRRRNDRHDDRRHKHHRSQHGGGFLPSNKDERSRAMRERYLAAEEDDRKKEIEEAEKRRQEEMELEYMIANHRTLGAAGDDDSDDECFVAMNSPSRKVSDSDSDNEAPPDVKKPRVDLINVYTPLTTTPIAYGRAPFVVYKTSVPDAVEVEMRGIAPRKKYIHMPVKLTDKMLEIGRIENYFKPRTFYELKDSNTFKLDCIMNDPHCATAPSRFEPITEPEFKYEESENDFRQTAFILRSSFVHSPAEKRQQLLMSSKNRSGISKAEMVEKWIEIIRLEDEVDAERAKDKLFRGSVDTVGMKLGKLEEAFKECSGAPNIYDLYLFKIELLAEKDGHQSQEVENAWNSCINKFPNVLSVWRKFITFHRSKMSIFNCEKHEKLVFRCLEKLNGIVSGTFASHPKKEGTEDFIVDVILAAATLYIESGRTNIVAAILQAYIECHLYVPGGYNDFSSVVADFKRYWESPVLKAGSTGAKGWMLSKDDNAPKKTDDEECVELGQATIENQKQVLKTIKECVKEGKHDVQIWRETEKLMTEAFWQPSVNKIDDKFPIFDPYVPFDKLKPFLIEFPEEERAKYASKIIFSLLVKLGAVIPAFENYSQEELCKEWSDSFSNLSALNMKGMDTFVENALFMVAKQSTDVHFLRCVFAIIITERKWIEMEFFNRHDEDGIEEKLKARLVKKSRLYVPQFKNQCYKNYANAFLSCFYEQLLGLKDFFLAQSGVELKDTMTFEVPAFQEKDNNPHILLSTLKLSVVYCQMHPHAKNDQPNGNTKLAMLCRLIGGKLSFTDHTEVSIEELQKALTKWSDKWSEIRTIRTDTVTSWIGNIKDLYLQLYATFLYEYERDPRKKMRLVTATLEDWDKESVTHAEVYFGIWRDHLKRYNLGVTGFMESLQGSVTRYPNSAKLLKYYADFYPRNLIGSFLVNSLKSIDDEIGRTIRAICMIAVEKKKLQNKSARIGSNNSEHLLKLLQGVAKLGSKTLNPETYFWRSLVVDTVLSAQPSVVDETLQLAIEQCSYSKLLFLDIAERKNAIMVSQKLPALAKEKKQLVLCSQAMLKEFIDLASV